MGKLTGFIASAVLMAGMGAASLGETTEVLGAADYQAMSKSEVSIIAEESNTNININNTNTNTNVSVVECTPNCEVSSSSTSITEKSVTEKSGGRNINISNTNNNTNVNVQQRFQCLALCAGSGLKVPPID
jgi:hypothetical protein